VKLGKNAKNYVFNMIPKTNDKFCNGNSRQPHEPRNSHIDITNEPNAYIVHF